MNCYVCVLSTDDYLNGVLILYENLKFINSKYKLLCLVNENISNYTKEILEYFNIEYKLINAVSYNTQNNIHPQWKYTFDKLNVFSLIEYQKIVYLDCDILILHNIDDLFEKKSISMVRDCPWKPDSFASGIMVVTPNISDFKSMISMSIESDRNNKPIGDQDIINSFFNDINELDQSYCVTRQVLDYKCQVYDYVNNRIEYKYLVHKFITDIDNINILHYAGIPKPFMLDGEFDDIYSELYSMYLRIVKEKIMCFEMEKKYKNLLCIVDSLDKNVVEKLDTKCIYINFNNYQLNYKALYEAVKRVELYDLNFCELYINRGDEIESHWEDEWLSVTNAEVKDLYINGVILNTIDNKVFDKDFLLTLLQVHSNIDDFCDFVINSADRVLLLNEKLVEGD